MKADPLDSLYHGRRTVDELVGALAADNPAAAMAHKELSLMHLDRFIAAVTGLADTIDQHRGPPPAGA
ncbi:hypothetical protein FHS31_002911 [Sphingomonas vulcanisoli]|uniref:Uncharacterized protein n=1 Tax=Sphingomonas vulcanisoli TaxID=1658060 RepID=A0ABX0TUS8_9SPHN|nr:hypothetical protein [Sphingomonas vulcanisoli]NIJ09279.1 hypothetical protein [Sphingomonas vulcanisoli]